MIKPVHAWLLIFIFVLVGCNGDDSDSAPPTKSKASKVTPPSSPAHVAPQVSKPVVDDPAKDNEKNVEAEADKPQPPDVQKTPEGKFNSSLAFEVYTEDRYGRANIGTTPSTDPITLPTTEPWWVSPIDLKEMTAVAAEIKAKNIPAIEMPPEADDAAIAHLENLPSLKRVILSKTAITNDGLAHLATLENLEELELSQCKINDVGMRHLNKFTRLRKLHLNGNEITGKGLNELANNSDLRQLELGGTLLEEDKDFVPLKNFAKLEVLDLGGTPVSDSKLSHLATLVELRELQIEGDYISEVGLSHLTGMTKLEELTILDAKVTDVGLKELENAIGMKELMIPKAELTDQAMSTLVKFKDLKSLSLGASKFSDDGIAELVALSNLRYLWIPSSPITDAGLKHLAKMKLEILELSNKNVTPEGIAELKKAIPGCTVTVR